VLVDNPEPLIKAGRILSSHAGALTHYFDSIDDCANRECGTRIKAKPSLLVVADCANLIAGLRVEGGLLQRLV
jgi:hypothetical protein